MSLPENVLSHSCIHLRLIEHPGKSCNTKKAGEKNSAKNQYYHVDSVCILLSLSSLSAVGVMIHQ